ncbi:MAG: YCF48-related protein [Bacteroidia bacterium]|nr:YCF48-related protein [Bacteroidia bacterium]MDW8300899.1 T9SS type A sorting domain-containing protein [Bacteroidia bacterium]
MKNYPYILALLCMFGVAHAQSWQTQATGFTTPSRGITNVSIVNPNVVWASAYDGSGSSAIVHEFTRTLNGGATWTPGVYNAPGISGYSTAQLFALNKDTAWVIMYNGSTGGGKVIRTNDGGANWFVQPTATFSPPAGFGNVIHFFNANEGFCMGDPNGGYYEIYTTTNGGTNWVRVPSSNIPPPLTASEYGLTNSYAVVGNKIWFGTTQGRIYKSNNKGLNWTVHNTPFASNVYIVGLAFKDSLNGLAIGLVGSSNAGIIKTTDGGNTWTMLSTGITGGLDAKTTIAYVPGTRGTYVIGSIFGTMPGSAYTCDDGATWNNIDNVQHAHTSFINSNTGFSGSFNIDAFTGGMFKWDAPPAPTIITKDTTICAGNPVTLQATGAGTIYWYTSGSGGFPIGTGSTLTVTPSSTTTYFAEVVSGGKTSFRNYVIVTVNPSPSATITGPTTVVENLIYSYSVPSTTGASYNWNVTGGTIISGAGTNSIMVQWGSAGTGTVSVTVTLGACTKSNSINVTINMATGLQNEPVFEVKIYPNPVQEKLYLQIDHLAQATLYDSYGRRVMSFVAKQGLNEIELGQMAKGMYLLTLQNDNKLQSIPILIE